MCAGAKLVARVGAHAWPTMHRICPPGEGAKHRLPTEFTRTVHSAVREGWTAAKFQMVSCALLGSFHSCWRRGKLTDAHVRLHVNMVAVMQRPIDCVRLT